MKNVLIGIGIVALVGIGYMSVNNPEALDKYKSAVDGKINSVADKVKDPNAYYDNKLRKMEDYFVKLKVQTKKLESQIQRKERKQKMAKIQYKKALTKAKGANSDGKIDSMTYKTLQMKKRSIEQSDRFLEKSSATLAKNQKKLEKFTASYKQAKEQRSLLKMQVDEANSNAELLDMEQSMSVSDITAQTGVDFDSIMVELETNVIESEAKLSAQEDLNDLKSGDSLDSLDDETFDASDLEL